MNKKCKRSKKQYSQITIPTKSRMAMDPSSTYMDKERKEQ